MLCATKGRLGLHTLQVSSMWPGGERDAAPAAGRSLAAWAEQDGGHTGLPAWGRGCGPWVYSLRFMLPPAAQKLDSRDVERMTVVHC